MVLQKLGVLLIMISTSVPWLVAQSQVSSTTVTHYPAKPLPGVRPPKMTMAMPSVAPLFINTDKISSSLMLVNNAARRAGATLTVYGLDGSTVSAKHLILQPNSQLLLEGGAFMSGGLPLPPFGSLTVLQDSDLEGAAVNAQLLLTNLYGSIPTYIDEELFMPSMSGSQLLRGVADAAEATPALALTNTSETEQTATIKCIRENAAPVSVSLSVAAHATAVSIACHKEPITSIQDEIDRSSGTHDAAVTGIEITGSGMPGSLAAFALGFHRHHESPIFSSVNFVDPKAQQSSSTIYPGVPAGTQTVLSDGVYTPHVALTNFSSKAAHVTVLFSTSGLRSAEDGASSQDATAALTPRQIQLKPYESRQVVLENAASLGGLQHSIVIASDQLPGLIESKVTSRSDGNLYQVELPGKDSKDQDNAGGHPWTLTGDTQATLLLYNFSANAITYRIYIPQGTTKWEKNYTVAPFETLQLSVEDLISQRVQDDRGRVLAFHAQTGVVYWHLANPGLGTGRLLISSRSQSLARNFSCGSTFVVCALQLEIFNYGDIPIAGYTDYGDAIGEICTAWGPGDCSDLTSTGGEGGSASWSIGNTSIVNFNTPGDQTSSTPNFKGVSKGSTSAYVSLSENGCSASGSGNPSPTVPTPDHSVFLSQIFKVATPNSNIVCNAGYSGWDRRLSLQIATASGQYLTLDGIPLTETVSVGGANSLQLPTNVNTGTTTTMTAGAYTDEFYFCSKLCPGNTGTTGAIQTLTYDGIPVTHTNLLTYSCQNVLFNNQ